MRLGTACLLAAFTFLAVTGLLDLLARIRREAEEDSVTEWYRHLALMPRNPERFPGMVERQPVPASPLAAADGPTLGAKC
jgi:hypothetical protein